MSVTAQPPPAFFIATLAGGYRVRRGPCLMGKISLRPTALLFY
jgi:hypothetical protein